MISGFNKLLVAPIHYSVQDQFEKQYLDDTVVGWSRWRRGISDQWRAISTFLKLTNSQRIIELTPIDFLWTIQLSTDRLNEPEAVQDRDASIGAELHWLADGLAGASCRRRRRRSADPPAVAQHGQRHPLAAGTEGRGRGRCRTVDVVEDSGRVSTHRRPGAAVCGRATAVDGSVGRPVVADLPGRMGSGVELVAEPRLEQRRHSGRPLVIRGSIIVFSTSQSIVHIWLFFEMNRLMTKSRADWNVLCSIISSTVQPFQ